MMNYFQNPLSILTCASTPGVDVTPLARRLPALMDPWLDGGVFHSSTSQLNLMHFCH
jgi:hypothetical protein